MKFRIFTCIVLFFAGFSYHMSYSTENVLSDKTVHILGFIALAGWTAMNCLCNDKKEDKDE
ncbi:MAG: hypothetical protein J7L15_00370 [Clostridiales bacterium]|nr:hypothetical protein [Clostridiales bacterium]